MNESLDNAALIALRDEYKEKMRLTVYEALVYHFDALQHTFNGTSDEKWCGIYQIKMANIEKALAWYCDASSQRYVTDSETGAFLPVKSDETMINDEGV